MRSGPSMAATSCRTRRQRKRSGGPSGTSASASIGSGRAKSLQRPRRRRALRDDRLVSLSAEARLAERRRGRRLGLFGQMRFDQRAPRHRARPEPGAQAVDEIGERAGPLGLVRPLELGLRGRERLGRKTREAHEVDAEAGVDRVLLRARELFGEQADERARFVERPGGADPDAAHVAVDAIEGRARSASPPSPAARCSTTRSSASLRKVASIASTVCTGEAKRRSAQKSGAAKRGAIEARSRPLSASSRAIGSAPNRAVIGARGLKAMSPTRFRPARAMSATVAVVEAEGGERQIVEEFGEGLVAHLLGRNLLGRKARQRPGGARIAGDAGCGRDAEGGEAADASLDQRRFAAEQMRHARNIEHQAVGAIERGERGEARAPVAETLEKPRLFRRVRLDRDEGGMARARVRQREAGRQAELCGVGVDADEPLGVLDPGDRRERRRPVNGLAAAGRGPSPDAAAREREIAGSSKVLSSLRHSSLTARAGSTCSCAR